MIPSLLNTAGELEREARSRRWNAIEALGAACVTFVSAWLIAYACGILGGNPAARDFGGAPLYAIMVFAFFVSPWLHRDSPESWGLGSPRRLWSQVRQGPRRRRWATALAALALFAGLVWLAVARWPQVARACHLPASTRHWPESPAGLAAVVAVAILLAGFLAAYAVRYDNFVPAFLTALKVSAGLILFALAAAFLQRGWPVVKSFQPGRYLLGVVGYFFWGYFQQLLFCAWFGTRLRKAFPPSVPDRMAGTPGRRCRSMVVSGSGLALVLAPAVWLTIRAVRGPDALGLAMLGWFALFAFPVGAAWGWFFAQDRQRLLVATLSGSFFGLIHIDSYGLVIGTWLLGTILAWIFMEDRKRNIAALGFIHGLLGTTLSLLFNGPEAGALKISYRVGPWNVEHPTATVLLVPLLFLAGYAGLLVWCARKLPGTTAPARR